MRDGDEKRQWWHVRVDLRVPDDEGWRVTPIADELRTLLGDQQEAPGPNGGVDQGTGAELFPVVGLLFWVHAEDVGKAAAAALDLAQRAGSTAGAGPDYFDLSLVPQSAIRGSESSHVIMPAD